MREAVIAIGVTLLIAALMLAAVRHGRHLDNLERQVVALEREIAYRQMMLDDMHDLLPHLERRVVCLESDMSAREWMWIMADVLQEHGCNVAFH